jgi:type I restriction enzyme S subunit
VKVARIEDVSEFVLDGTHGSPVRVEIGVPVLSAQNVKHGVLSYETDRFTTEEEFRAFSSRMPFKTGDLLLTIVGTIGRSAVLTEVRPLVFQRSVAIIRPKSSVLDSRFFFHATQVQDFQSQLARSSNTSSQAGVYLGKIKEVTIPLPPLAEQRRIAEVLDRAGALRDKRRAALAQLDSFTQSLFLDLFGNPVVNLKKWKLCAVGEVADSIVPGRDKPRSFTGSIPWITTDDLHHLQFTFSSPKGLGLSAAEISEVRARVIPKGSVIISCVGDLGIVSLAGADMVINQQLHSFQCHEIVNNVFLMHCLAFQEAFMYAKASSTTLPYMNKTVCNSIPVIVPPISLQREFARRVTTVEKLKTAQRASLGEMDALFASLQHRAFRGEL